MSTFKKSLLVSTALLLGMQETWSLPRGRQETQEDGQKHPSVTKKEPPEIEKKFIKNASDLYYEDDDISEYIDYSIQQSNKFNYFKDSKYLLSATKEEFSLIEDQTNSKSYIVAISPAIDTRGTDRIIYGINSVNVGFFLDKSLRPKDENVEILEGLIQLIPSLEPNNFRSALKQKALELRKGEGRLERLEEILNKPGSNLEKVQQEINEELNYFQQLHKDVFEELMPFLLINESAHAKILFPYNQTEFHWLTGEIHLHREDSAYKIKIYTHNPYGNGELEDSQFSKLKEVIQKRIQDYHHVAQFTTIQNLQSPYARRQPEGDGISCGAIVAEDLLARITGTSLGNGSYSVGARELRKAQLEIVSKINPSASFIDRNRPKLEFITKYENELNDLGALFNRLNHPHGENFSNQFKQSKKKHITDADLENKLQQSTQTYKNDTLAKLEEISRQVLKIKENYKKIESHEDSKEPLLHAIKEALLRISWRVEEIPSYDKFHMGSYFPEKNWLFLGHLSSILNSITDKTQLKNVLLTLSSSISEIEEAIPVIKKIIEKKELEEKEKVKIQLPSFEEIASFFMDTEFLKKIKDSTASLSITEQANSNEHFALEENTKRAVFRTFEIIGECAKYISLKLKECNTNIPWQPSSLDFLFPSVEESTSKGNILTTLRNKFHHDRDRLELIFQYEPKLLISLLYDVIPFLHKEVTQLVEERDKAFEQLTPTDFATLNTSLTTILKSKLVNNSNPSSEKLKIPPIIRETLKSIVEILIKNEDEASSLSGRKIKELLSYIKKEDNSIYQILLKNALLPNTEDKFIELVQQQVNNPPSFLPYIEQKFRKAYTKMKGKKVTEQQLKEALQQPPSKPLPLSISEIKHEIREIILNGKACNSQDFREKFLKPIFFKGIKQKEGEKRLEELRATVSVNTSSEEIEKLFDLSVDDRKLAQEKSYKTLASSNEVKGILQDIYTLPKNKIGKNSILKLIGLSNEDRESLVETLSKEPLANPQSETVRKRFSNSSELKEKILKNLKGEKVKIDKKNQLGQLINTSNDDQNEIWKIINLPLEKRTKEESQKIEAILSKCPKSFEEYQPIYEEEYNRKFQGKQRSQEEVEAAQRILEKVPTTAEAFDILQQENRKKIRNILLKTEPIIREENFDFFVSTLCYTDSLVNKIKAKYKNILSQNSNLEERLDTLLGTIDESVTPQNYLKTVLENGWLLPDELQGYFKGLVAIAKLSWEEFEHLYIKKKNNCVKEEDIIEANKKLDDKIIELSELNNLFHNTDQEGADNTHRIKKINELKALIKNFMLKVEPDRTEEYFKDLAEEAKLNWKEFQHLYLKKRDHLLTQQDIDEAINQLNSKIRKLNEENNNTNLADKERIKNNQQIEKINNFKLAIKNIPSLTEESFKKLIEKAGYLYSDLFKNLYTTITSQGKSELPLYQLKEDLINKINKLDTIFQELKEEHKVNAKHSILRMAAEYLIEEIGPAAERLINRSDYAESSHLSTSRRNLYLIAMCRKAMAHHPLSIDEDLFSYLIDQLVLDAKVRFDKSSNSNLEIFSEDVTFNKNRKITWEDLERKRTDIYAVVEGLGFRSDFKIFGTALGCDIGIQGNLNLLVERYDSPAEKNFQNLTELEIRLSRLLNGDVRVYTDSTLAKRLSSKIDPKHQEEIKKQATYTLEDIIRGNSFVSIFRENRWASFRMPDGRIFTRSQFLEQQDLRKVFSFLIRLNFSAEELEDLLSERENLQRIVKEKIDLYNSSPNEYSKILKDVFLPLSLVVSFYDTGFHALCIPVRKTGNDIHYKYFIPFGYIPQHKAFLSVEELPSQWNLIDFQKLPPFMQSLYIPVEQTDGPKIFIKCDETFKEILTRIERRELLPERLEENTARDIANLLYNKKHRILEILSPHNLINTTKIFNAITVDYAYNQKEFEEEQKNIEDFRRARLEKNEELQNIIKEKALKYKGALEKELSVLSGRMRECVLKYVLLEKKIGGFLKNLYKQQKEDLTLLWEIMDEEQKIAVSHLIENGDARTLAPDIQNIISSFTHMSMSTKKSLDFIKDNQIKEEVKNFLEKQKNIIQDITKELLRQNLPQSWQDNTQVVSFKSGEGTYYGFQFDRPRFVNGLNINPFHFSETEAQRIADKYLAIFFAIRDPQVIHCFLRKEDPETVLYNDFCKRYCEKEEPSITFIADIQGSQEEYKLVDFASEVEYTQYKRKEEKKQNLVEILEKAPSLPQSLRELIIQGKEEKTRRDDEVLLGFTGEAWEVYAQIAARGIEQVPEVPNLVVENLPNSISQIDFSKIIISLRLETKSKTIFSNAIQDLDHLMQLYGWSEQGKEAYKAKNNFSRNNEIIKEYFQFRRLIKALDAATSQEHEYERKIADFKNRLEFQNYTVFQRARLSVDHKIYIQALEQNHQNKITLTEEIAQHPYLQRKISSALRDPNFLYTLYNQSKEHPVSDKEIDSLITYEMQILRERALRELVV